MAYNQLPNRLISLSGAKAKNNKCADRFAKHLGRYRAKNAPSLASQSSPSEGLLWNKFNRESNAVKYVMAVWLDNRGKENETFYND
jgi:hypothetical protein